MTANQAGLKVSAQPDPIIMGWLARADTLCLVVTAIIALITLGVWWIPTLGAALSPAWSLMMANTALLVLLCTASLALSKNHHGSGWIVLSRMCAVGALLIAGVELIEHSIGHATGFLDPLLASHRATPLSDHMPVQTSSFMVLLGLSLLIERTRADRLGQLLDILIGAIVMLSLVIIAGYLFNVPSLVGGAGDTTVPQTVICLALLAWVRATRRAPDGFFSVLVGVGIGSQFARIALPLSQVLVFVLIGLGYSLLQKGHVSLPYAVALTASSMAALLFVLVILLARKINDLEGALRDASLTDELTGLHNRRGFYLLGEQALREVRRVKTPLSILFFDVDGLKKVNDTLGHEVGSELLRDIAHLLTAAFRGSEVVGRLGGDEFAVITRSRDTDLAPALRRLDEATEAVNNSGRKPYRISVSRGGATIEAPSEESFDAVVDRADAAMYQNKLARRAQRDAPELLQAVGSIT